MDALELLNVLDIIKNQEVYEKRYELLKAEQKKLEELQDIVKTLEEAKRRRVEADVLRDKYIKKLADSEGEIEAQRKLQLSDLDEREAKLDLREDVVTKQLIEVREQFDQLRREQAQLKIDRENLVKQTSAVQRSLEEANDIRTRYNVKLNELQRIIANG